MFEFGEWKKLKWIKSGFIHRFERNNLERVSGNSFGKIKLQFNDLTRWNFIVSQMGIMGYNNKHAKINSKPRLQDNRFYCDFSAGRKWPKKPTCTRNRFEFFDYWILKDSLFFGFFLFLRRSSWLPQISSDRNPAGYFLWDYVN